MKNKTKIQTIIIIVLLIILIILIKLRLTGNTYVTTLNDEDTSYSNIDFNGYTLYVNGEAIN